MIGKTNAGGSNVGGKLTVKAPANVNVKAVKGNSTRTQSSGSGGSAVFRGLSQGSWNISISNSEQTVTVPITITTDYSMSIAFFSSKITVTYPSGSKCTCTNGSTTYTASNTSGSWTFTVPRTGTWTVKCSNGSNSASTNVSVTANGQSFSVSLIYWDGYLYKLGNNQYTGYTGGWIGGTYNSEGTLDYTASGSPDSVIRTNGKVDLTNFKTLVFDGIMWGNTSGGSYGGNMVVCSGADGSGVVAQKNIGTTAWGQYSLDISSVKGSYYVRFSVGGNDHSIRMRNCYLQK